MRIKFLVAACACLLLEAQSFEVASIRPSQGGKGGSNLRTSANTVTIHNLPLRAIICSAYGIADYQIAGPDWMKRERFDIIAKTGAPVPSEDEMLPLLQPLLADRFGLSLHRETKNLPAFVLTVAKGGPRMDAAKGDAAVPKVQKAGKGGSTIRSPRMSMAELAAMISRRLGSPVRDMTNLEGRYKVDLEWLGKDKDQRPDKGKRGKNTAGSRDLPSIFTAVTEQLGLKLEARKTQVEVFVIDHVERTPSGN